MPVAARAGQDEHSGRARLDGQVGMPESATGEELERRCPVGDWHALKTNPDYRAEWRARGGAAQVGEAAGFALRGQTEADLEAARWGLMAWENPRERSRFKPFWIDERMIAAAVVEPRDTVAPVGMLVRATGMSVTGLRLLDGALVLKVRRGRRMEQIRVLEGDTFDLERSGLELQIPFDGYPSAVLPRLQNLAAIMTLRKRPASNR